MTSDLERIRLRAYELWVAEGRPESRDMEYWLRAEQEINGPDATAGGRGGANEGEGNRTAAREFNRQEVAFVSRGGVEAKAKEAKEAVDGPEGEELRRAEAAGRSRSRGEDPSVNTPQTPGGGQANEGEGNRTAAREFNRQETQFVRSGGVDAKAREAKEAVEGPEGEELRRAEAKGKSRSRGEDPAVSSRNPAATNSGNSSRGKGSKSAGKS
ncbi:MAG: hypothetical protein QOK29_3338 [Rhodospirillaceae bacterium]|nr:hypothetical protein [Rhodospirillaceae bacterium]